MEASAAAALARHQLDVHGLVDWAFAFDRARRRFGACHYSRRTITLSRELTRLNTEDTVRDVVLHEVAHALAGHRAGHGPAWRRIADRLGVRPRGRLADAGLALPLPRYLGTCPTCAGTIRRHRRDRSACTGCCRAESGGRFSERHLYVWSLAPVDVEPVAA
jgi:predicted SprT family Zn-dependent metalloprotease